MKGLEDKVAIVTASAGAGIGQGIARSLLEKGATPVITSRTQESTDEVASQLSEEYNTEVLGFQLDVTDADRAQTVVDAVVDHYGRLDVLVNNAGVNQTDRIHEMDLETWHWIFDINIHGMFYCTRAAILPMLEQGSGTVINIASIAGWDADKVSGNAPYASTKAAVMSFTRSIASDFASDGIRANCIVPGFVANEYLEEIYDEEYLESLTDDIPLERPGERQDVGDVACFFASEESRYVTGQSLAVSGGQYMQP